MRVQITEPQFVNEALFGVGLSHGLTSAYHDMRLLGSNKSELNRLKQIALKLASKPGGGHDKFMETITLVLDVTAPRYWWQEFDTYRVGMTKQSESTMHTLVNSPFSEDDFEGEISKTALNELNALRREALSAKVDGDAGEAEETFLALKRMLPESFLQRRIVCTNAKALKNIYRQRKDHRLPEWRTFFDALRQGLSWTSDGLFVWDCIAAKEATE